MGREGFLCTNLPAKIGGLGGDFLYSVIVAEEVIRTDQGLTTSMHSNIIVPYPE